MIRFAASLAASVVLVATLAATVLHAESPEILKATARRADMGWRIDVTLKHPDTGWDHYADGWEVLDGEGNRLAYRELMHPHVDEQPFTRALLDVMLPDGTREVFIRAHCSEDGWSDETYALKLAP